MELVDYAYKILCGGIILGAAVGLVFGNIMTWMVLGLLISIPIMIIAIRIKDPTAFSRKLTKKEQEHNAKWGRRMHELRAKILTWGMILAIIILAIQFYKMTRDPVFIQGMAAWKGEYPP